MCLHVLQEDSTSSSTCHMCPRAHAPMCLMRPMRPRVSRAPQAFRALHVPRSSSNLLTSFVMSSCSPRKPSAFIIIRHLADVIALLLTFEEGWPLNFSRINFLQSRCSSSVLWIAFWCPFRFVYWNGIFQYRPISTYHFRPFRNYHFIYIYILVINKKMLLLIAILKPNFINVISSFNECKIAF